MKITKLSFLSLLPFLLLLLALPAQSAQRFSVFGTKVGTTYTYAVVPPGGVSVVEFLEAYSPSSVGNVSILTAGAAITISNAVAAGSSNILSATSALAPGKHVVLHDVSAGEYQVGTVLYTNGTGFVVTNAPGSAALATSFALVPGDKVYLMTTNYTAGIAVGGTKSLTANAGGGIVVSPVAARPLLIQTFNTGTNADLIVTGRYE